jgi:hypothetical protein
MQGAIWVSGIIGSFLLPPPVGVLKEEHKLWLRLAQFIIAVLVGLLFILKRKWNKKSQVKWWSVISAAALVLSVACFTGYQYLLYSWTCNYNQQSVVIGTDYTPQGAYYVKQNPQGITCDELVADFAGKVEDIWTKRSINRARLILAGTYISCLPLFTVCLIAVLHAIHVGEPRVRRKKRKSAISSITQAP